MKKFKKVKLFASSVGLAFVGLSSVAIATSCSCGSEGWIPEDYIPINKKIMQGGQQTLQTDILEFVVDETIQVAAKWSDLKTVGCEDAANKWYIMGGYIGENDNMVSGGCIEAIIDNKVLEKDVDYYTRDQILFTPIKELGLKDDTILKFKFLIARTEKCTSGPIFGVANPA